MSKVMTKFHVISKKIQFREKIYGSPQSNSAKLATDEFSAVTYGEAAVFLSGNRRGDGQRNHVDETIAIGGRELNTRTTISTSPLSQNSGRMRYRSYRESREKNTDASAGVSNIESLAWCRLLYNRTYSSSTVTSSPGSPFTKISRRRKCRKGRRPVIGQHFESDDVTDHRSMKDKPPVYTTLYRTPPKDEPFYHTLAPPDNNNTCVSNASRTERGQLKLNISATQRQLAVKILELRGVVQHRRQKSGIYVRLSLCPDFPDRERYKSSIVPVLSKNIGINETFSFQIPEGNTNRRLLISTWQKFEHRQNSDFVGCMSFSIRKLVIQQKAVRGWYQLLGETLGRRKHLAARAEHATDAKEGRKSAEAKREQKVLRDRQHNNKQAAQALEDYYKNYCESEKSPVDNKPQPHSKAYHEKENAQPSCETRKVKIMRRRRAPRSRNSPCLRKYLHETGRPVSMRKRDSRSSSSGRSPHRGRRRGVKEPSESPKLVLQAAVVKSYCTKSAKIIAARGNKQANENGAHIRVLYTDERECASHNAQFRPRSVASQDDSTLSWSKVKSTANTSESENSGRTARSRRKSHLYRRNSEYMTIKPKDSAKMPPVQSDVICADSGVPLDENIFSQGLTLSKTGRVRAKKPHTRMATYLHAQQADLTSDSNIIETSNAENVNSSQIQPKTLLRLSSEAVKKNSKQVDSDRGYCSDPELVKVAVKSTAFHTQERHRTFTESKLTVNNSSQQASGKLSRNHSAKDLSQSSQLSSNRTPSRKRNNGEPGVYSEITTRESEAKTAEVYSLKHDGLKMPKYHSMKEKDIVIRAKKDLSPPSSDEGRILHRSNTFSSGRRSFAKKSFRQSRKSPSPPATIEENVKSNDIPLEDMLKNKAATQAFREFLKSEYSEENLDFWLDCEYYRTLKGSKLLKAAFKIFSQYLARSAPREVNIDCEIRSMTEENLKNPDKHTFVESQNCIYTLMKCDSFRRFLASEKYQKLQSESNDGFKLSLKRPSMRKKLSR